MAPTAHSIQTRPTGREAYILPAPRPRHKVLQPVSQLFPQLEKLRVLLIDFRLTSDHCVDVEQAKEDGRHLQAGRRRHQPNTVATLDQNIDDGVIGSPADRNAGPGWGARVNSYNRLTTKPSSAVGLRGSRKAV
jgi:hypothetical protein